VEDECSKYGKIRHSAVDTRSPAGHVYMLFKEGEEEGAHKSAQALNGRWFAGRMIVVEFISVESYMQRYPKAEAEAEAEE